MAMTIDMRERNGLGSSSTGGAPSATGRARAFRIARRHSTLVRTLRIAMPVGAGVLMLSYALALTSSWQFGPGRLNPGQVEVTADDLTMKNPSYFGVTKDGGRYEVRAKKAVLEFNRDAPIKLFDIDGDLVQANDVVTKLKATRGLLDNAKSELELFDNIEINGSNGLKARLSHATVYSKEHRVVSKRPVRVAMPTGTVQGAAMTLRTDTREASFIGDVTVTLVPSSGQTTSAFGRDSRQPVNVSADELHVNDAARTAQFSGKVVAVQGDSTLKAPNLQIEYEGKGAPELMTARPGASAEQSSSLKLLRARGGVVVTAGTDRRISSDIADFDAKADTALFAGNVLLNQQKNVLQGRRLYVDRKAGTSRLEASAEGGQPAGRIAATFYQNESKAAAPPKPKSATGEALASVQGGMLGSFKTDPNAPMDIEADTLDVYDARKQAVFRGRVKAQQGDFVVRTVELIAHFTGQSGFGLATGSPDASDKNPSQLTRVEAKEKVIITSKDGQTATGDWAIFDVKANTVLLGGRVVVTRGKDVAEGPRLKIDLTTGMYRFELENEPARTAAPATSASPPAMAVPPGEGPSAAGSPAGRTCPPGKQCLLFYPKDAHDKGKELLKKNPNSPAAKAIEGWQPSTSASPVLRGN